MSESKGSTQRINRQIPDHTRRALLKTGLVGVAGLALAGCVNNDLLNVPNDGDTIVDSTPPAEVAEPTSPPAQTAPTLVPTLTCDDDEPTMAQTAGPFYTPNTPERASFIEDGITGTRLVVTGRVLTTDCQPMAGAVLDFWHADDAGQYDNAGYRLRGHQFTDENGQYRLETIVPGLYVGRTRHIHVKVQGPNTRLLTTQMYFPNEPENARDSIFHPSLVMDVQDTSDGSQTGTFDFVLVA
jgi:protocatechuate 3,4-dioxygenase beta subunit